MANIDNLDIRISASSRNANRSITALTKNINNLASAMNKMNTSGLVQLSRGMQNMSSATNNLNKQMPRLTSNVRSFGSSSRSAHKSTMSLAYAFGKFYANCFLAIRGIKALGRAVKSSMDYIENLNYFESAFRSLDVSGFEKAGYESGQAYANAFAQATKSITTKMTGYNINDNGTLTQSGLGMGLNPTQLMRYQAQYVQMATSMGLTAKNATRVSEALTKIGGDLASVKNMEFEEVWGNMASAMVGMSRTVDKYGVNIRNANLQEKLLNLGINANISTLGQNDKALLRTIVLLESTKYAWGDLATTIESPANSIRVFKAQIQNLGRMLGELFLPVLQKVIPYLNGLVVALQRVVMYIGSIFGVQEKLAKIFEKSGATSGYSDLTSDILDEKDAMDDATASAKKFKSAVLGIDELNINNPNSDSGSGAGNGGGFDSDALSGALDDILSQYNKVWEDAYNNMENRASEFADKIVGFFKNNNAEQIGAAFGGWIANGLNSIPWDNVKTFASNLAEKFASFLNGFISPGLFGSVATTIAEALNTSIQTSKTFAEKFDFANLGESIATAVNKFFEKFDFGQLAESLNTWVNGLKDAIKGFADTIEWKEVFKSIFEFFENIEVDTAIFLIGALLFKMNGEKLTSLMFSSAIAKQIGATVSGGLVLGIELVLVGSQFAKDFSTWKENINKYGWTEGRKKTAEDKGDANPYKNNALLEGILEWQEQNRKVREQEKAEYGKWVNDVSAKISTTFSGFGEVTREALSNVRDEFNETTDKVSQSLSDMKSNWQTTWNNIKTIVKTTWDDTVVQWKTDIQKWWNDHVTPWFTKKKWTDATKGVIDGMRETFKNACNVAIDQVNKLIDWINSKMHFSWKGLTIAGKEIYPGGSVQLVNISKIPRFATGGFPEDGLFYANSNELVGQFSNGRTAVANNEQITEGIKRASYEGMMSAFTDIGLGGILNDIANSSRETANKDFSVSIGDRDIAKANIRGKQAIGMTLISAI